MEQLQKVLVYRFWIVAGLTPILAIVAWRAGAGSAKAQYETRSRALQGTFQRVDTLAGNNQAPNPKWKTAVTTVLSQAAEDQGRTWQTLYEQQKDLFQWPDKEIAEAVEQMQPAAEAAALQPVEISEQARRFYRRRDYDVAVGALRQKLLQIRGPDPDNPIVIVPDTLLNPYLRNWDATPTTQEVLDAQENIWILSLLLDVIAKVNEGATESYNAAIQEIIELQIADSVKRSASSGPLAAAGQGGQGQGQLGQSGGLGGGNQQGGGGQQGGLNPQGGDPGASLTATGRYVARTQEYKGIQFRMLLMIKHTEIPSLLVELINHPVPISITALRVEGPDFINQPGRKGAPEPMLPDIGRVEVVGTLKLFNKPPEPPGAAPALTVPGEAAAATEPGAAGLDPVAAPAANEP